MPVCFSSSILEQPKGKDLISFSVYSGASKLSGKQKALNQYL